MADADEPHATELKSKLRATLQRFAISMAALAFVWLLFGHIVPRLLFKPAPQPPAQPVDTPAAEVAAAVPEPAPQAEPMAEIPAPQTQAATPPAEPVAAPAANDDRIAKLEEKVAAQDAQIAELKTAFAAAQSKNTISLAALVAFGQLKDAVLHGDDFSAPLAQLKSFSAGNSAAQTALGVLAAHAQSGIVPLEKITANFSPLIPKALATKGDAYAKNISSVISIRKVGDVAGGDDEAILARAETHVAHGDLAAALKEVDAASPPVKAALAGWQDDAKNWLAARDQLNALQLALTQAPDPQPAPTPAP